jgi:DNA-binding LacI/PurR family transcriptional regulator
MLVKAFHQALTPAPRGRTVIALSASDPPNRVTLKDVAQSLGVSLATVSLAMRDDRRIPEPRRLQVKEAAERMGYRANPAATMLAHFKRASTVQPVQAALAWINAWPDPKQLRGWRDFDLYWQGASRAAQKFGYRLEEFVVNETITPRRLQQILLARNIRGILIPPHGQHFGAGTGYLDFSAFEWDQFSVVRFGHTIDLRVHSVTSDQTANGMMAFNKILERGYQRIAFVGRAHQGRFFGAGFLWAQSRLPQELRMPMFLFPDNYNENDPKLHRTITAWLKKVKPDAIFHDVLAFPRILRNAGYRVPQDIALASTTVLEATEPAIDAGLDQNSEEIGRVGVLVVLSQINDNARGLPPISRQVLVQGRWIDGASLPPRTAP